MSYTKYKDIVLSDFSKGLNTKFEDNKIAENESPDLQNVIFDGRNSIEIRKGTEQFAQSLSTLGTSGFTKTYCMNRSDGVQIPMAFFGTSAVYYNNLTGAWETLRQGFTHNYRFGATYYASLSVPEVVLFCNGIDSQYAWNGAYGQLSTAVSASDTVFYLSTSNALSTLGWLSAGSAVINGDEFYYASLSANALSSITRASNAANQVTQVGIAQLPVSATNTSASSLSAQPRGYIMHAHNGRVFVAGVSSAYQTCYYSKENDPYSYYYAAGLSSGDGGFAYFPEEGGGIISINSKEDNVIVFTKNTINKINFAEAGNVVDFPFSARVGGGLNMGAINDNGTCNVENDLFYVSPLGGVRTLSRLPNEDVQLQINQLTKMIEPTVNGLNLTSATSIYYYPKYYMAAATSGSTFNNVVLAYDYLYDSWTKFIGWNVNSWFIYGGELYYAASNELTTYKAMIDYDDNDGIIDAYWKSKQLDYDIPNEEKRLRFIYIEGYMTNNCQLSCNLYYNGEDTPITKCLSGTGSYIYANDEIEVFGKSTWGIGTYGGPGSPGSKFTLNKFRARLSYDNVDFFNMQFELKSQGDGMVWKVTYITPYVYKVDGKKFPINSII